MLSRFLLALCVVCAWNCSLAQTINPNDVTIIRDSLGVPHIFGKTDADAAYGLAYAHCEDNFSDMQEAVMAGKGLLGSYKGKDGVLFDFD